MFLISILTALFSFPAFGQPVPEEVEREQAYYACFSTDDPDTCIANLDS